MTHSSMNNPQHVGIIMDGNRRFSRRLMLEPWKGHEYGAKKLQEVLEWCRAAGVQTLTVYAFSYENFNRPKKELEYLMKLFKQEITSLLSRTDELKEKGMRIRVAGRTEQFPEELQKLLKDIQEVTQKNEPYTLNMCLAYSGRVELVDAFRRMRQENVSVDAITEEGIKKYLAIPDDPELIIRTGGERRLSNFLIYQAAYAELFFVDKLWPEFSREDFEKVLKEYRQRERRFGK